MNERSKIRLKIDRVFSRCVRMAAGWQCATCTKVMPDGLDCSHLHGRVRLGMRWLPQNCVAQCRVCHSYYTDNTAEFNKWRKEYLGDGDEALSDLSYDIHKFSTAELKDILKHYQQQEKHISPGCKIEPAPVIIDRICEAAGIERGAGMQ